MKRVVEETFWREVAVKGISGRHEKRVVATC